MGVYSIINREMLVEVEEDESNVTFAFDDNAFNVFCLRLTKRFLMLHLQMVMVPDCLLTK